MLFSPGDPVPWFVARATNNPQFHFDTAAGRYLVLCFLGSAASEPSRRVWRDIQQHRQRFDDENVAFFGISMDPDDERLGRLTQQLPGIRFFWDFDGRISGLYGALVKEPQSGAIQYRSFTLVLDPDLRVLAVFLFEDDLQRHAARLMEFLGRLPPIGPAVAAQPQAPVLLVPRIFDVPFCRTLIALYQQHGGAESGFMRQQGDKTVLVTDPGHKRRRDYEIADPQVRQQAMFAIHRRLVPEIKKAFQFEATRMERYIVACYDSASGGHFRPHRDNTTKGTAHRKFAISLNLNADEYSGGDLRFPEYGPQTYRPPTGGAVVFSCSLLHEATPVSEGRRFVFLPFLYDEQGARLRETNNAFLDDGVAPYRP